METTDGGHTRRGPDPGLRTQWSVRHSSNSFPLPYQDTSLITWLIHILQQDLQPTYPSVSLALPRSQAKFWKKKKTKWTCGWKAEFNQEKVNKVTCIFGFSSSNRQSQLLKQHSHKIFMIKYRFLQNQAISAKFWTSLTAWIELEYILSYCIMIHT